MHGTFDRSGRDKGQIQRHRDIRIIAIPTVLAIAMVALVLTQPAASRWISEAAQAEFAASFIAQEQIPAQFAQPNDLIRTARGN